MASSMSSFGSSFSGGRGPPGSFEPGKTPPAGGNDKHETCPYNSSHIVYWVKMDQHLERCRRGYMQKKEEADEPPMYLSCQWNYEHQIIAPELAFHEERCLDKGSVQWLYEVPVFLEHQAPKDEEVAKLKKLYEQCPPDEEEMNEMYEGMVKPFTFVGGAAWGYAIPYKDLGNREAMKKYRFKCKPLLDELERQDTKTNKKAERPSTSRDGAESPQYPLGGAAYYARQRERGLLKPLDELTSSESSASCSGAAALNSETEVGRLLRGVSDVSSGSSSSRESFTITSGGSDNDNYDDEEYWETDNAPHFSWWDNMYNPNKPFRNFYPPGLSKNMRREYDRFNTKWMENIKLMDEQHQAVKEGRVTVADAIETLGIPLKYKGYKRQVGMCAVGQFTDSDEEENTESVHGSFQSDTESEEPKPGLPEPTPPAPVRPESPLSPEYSKGGRGLSGVSASSISKLPSGKGYIMEKYLTGLKKAAREDGDVYDSSSSSSDEDD